jgi:hypothetical protein
MLIAVCVIVGVAVPVICYLKRGCLWYNIRKDAAARAYLRAKLRALSSDAPPAPPADPALARRPSLYSRMHLDLAKTMGRGSSNSLDEEEGSLAPTPAPAVRGDFSPARGRGQG